jgi:hypothetical protein
VDRIKPVLHYNAAASRTKVTANAQERAGRSVKSK